jgi:hypothetical protein
MNDPTVDEQREALKRKIFAIPCDTQEALHRWILLFLDLDIPDCIVDPDSNSSPMAMIWEIYSEARANNPDFSRALFYAARGCFKTLSAAILELLMVFHLNRNVAHMAAVENQSLISLGYTRAFFGRPPFRDFVEGDAKGLVVILRYIDRNDGKTLSKAEYESLSESEKLSYNEVRNFIKVVICNMKGANGLHASYLCTDELDVITDIAAYQESLMIPAADRPGVNPLSMLTSSRKFSFGLVQKEIDAEFDKDGERRLYIRHWNLIDVTEACPASRHRPDLPRLPIYLDEPNLVALSEEKYDKLTPEQQKKFVEKEGYTGCLTNCKMFAACRGLLATEQKSTSNLLRTITFTQTQFRTVSVPTANAQLLCRKPSTEGLIYPHLDRSIHMLTPAQIMQKITGEEYRPTLTKAEMIMLMKARGLRFSAGMDFGFSHNFAVPLAAIDGARAFVIGCISAPDLLPDTMIHRCNADIKSFNPSVWPDTARPDLIAMFKKSGYRMRDWDKGAGTVNNGIDIVCMRLRPTIGEPLLYFLAGDPEVELLFKNMSQYHWAIDTQGDPTNTPDEEDDDECDAIRYLIMNEFPPSKRIVSAPANDVRKAPPTALEEFKKHQANWFQKWKEDNGIIEGGPDGQSGKKGGFKWSL